LQEPPRGILAALVIRAVDVPLVLFLAAILAVYLDAVTAFRGHVSSAYREARAVG
jgi:hypothetical protein